MGVEAGVGSGCGGGGSGARVAAAAQAGGEGSLRQERRQVGLLPKRLKYTSI